MALVLQEGWEQVYGIQWTIEMQMGIWCTRNGRAQAQPERVPVLLPLEGEETVQAQEQRIKQTHDSDASKTKERHDPGARAVVAIRVGGH